MLFSRRLTRVALSYLRELKAEMGALDLDIPVLIGGRLNQIPEASNSSLPVEVTDELAAAGATVCRAVADAAPALLAIARQRTQDEGVGS